MFLFKIVFTGHARTATSLAYTVASIARTLANHERTAPEPSPTNSLPLPPCSSVGFTRWARCASFSQVKWGVLKNVFCECWWWGTRQRHSRSGSRVPPSPVRKRRHMVPYHLHTQHSIFTKSHFTQPKQALRPYCVDVELGPRWGRKDLVGNRFSTVCARLATVRAWPSTARVRQAAVR